MSFLFVFNLIFFIFVRLPQSFKETSLTATIYCASLIENYGVCIHTSITSRPPGLSPLASPISFFVIFLLLSSLSSGLPGIYLSLYPYWLSSHKPVASPFFVLICSYILPQLACGKNYFPRWYNYPTKRPLNPLPLLINRFPGNFALGF